MSWLSELDKLLTIKNPFENCVVREYNDSSGKFVQEVIPRGMLSEWRQLIKEMKEVGVKDVNEFKKLLEKR